MLPENIPVRKRNFPKVVCSMECQRGGVVQEVDQPCRAENVCAITPRFQLLHRLGTAVI